IQLLWQTGENNYKSLKHLETEKIKIKPYIKEMDLAYAISDLVISRAGALTLSELLVCGMPSILLPLPTATADHQTKNAKTIVQAGAAIMINQNNMDVNLLRNTILELINDKNKLSMMRKNALQLAKPNATSNIVKNILKVAQV
ncbi:MAG: glycosyltransferase, partial [Candidatus Marinimicrobia bacterium]|nr:glycosyltransferase [Candidatus Neomarinimicrobiota bacterium]